MAAEQQAKTPISVRLVPDEVTLQGMHASQRFLVLARCADGLERDLTSRARFVVSDPQVAQVEATGRLRAVADGRTRLVVEVEDLKAESMVRVEGSSKGRSFSFEQDIGGILTKRGCNTSDCHGSVKGKGGFKLSMNALYPREDYEWIVEGGAYQVLTPESAGPRVPRINVQAPEKSLLLLKPTLQITHGGGQSLGMESADRAAILNWIRAGAPYGEDGQEGARTIERLEVVPQEAVLDLQGRHQILVRAYLANGGQEDVTDQSLFVSNNPEVVEVTPRGLVRARGTGETTVMVRAPGQEVSATFGVIAQPLAEYPEVPRRNLIDDYVFTKLRKFNIVPADLSNDAEFLRRVCLDVAGTLPPPARVTQFLADRDPNRRDRLIETLLGSPEYVDYWTFRFADLFRVSFYNQGGAKYAQMYWRWIREGIASNKPYDQIARERISAQGYSGSSRHFYHEGAELPSPADMMAEQMRVFMGRRLDCAQCHNHPYEMWSQDQFWGMSAFFGRLTRLGQLGRDIVVMDDPAGHGELGQGAKVIHPRTKKEVNPTLLNGIVLSPNKRQDLRKELAAWMTSHPFFAEAAVNRIWGYFFGRGIVDPVDDFRSGNPPTHPGLLTALAKNFRNHNYDLKHLVRLICQSRTYQLSSLLNETNRDDKINYSAAFPRPLDAEVLLDAISQVSGVPETFTHKMAGQRPHGTRAINLIQADLFPSRFLEVYEKATRLTVPERENRANLGQALHMLVGSTYTERLSQPGSRIERLVKGEASDGEIVEELYLAALCRFPTDRERNRILEKMSRQSSRGEALEDFLWALVSSREFAHNH